MKKMLISKKGAGINTTVVMVILALVVFLALLFIPRMLQSAQETIDSTGSCEANFGGVTTKCKKECTGKWKEVPGGLISSDNCLTEEGYVCCMTGEISEK